MNELNTILSTMPSVQDLTCEQHGAFKGYSAKNCPKCIENYKQAENKRIDDEYVLKRKIELGVGERYYHSSFDNYKISNNKQLEMVNQLKLFNGDKNLILAGNKGTGKTHLAISVMDKLLRNKKSCMYIKFYNLIKLNFKDTHLMEKILNVEFLIIDEFGLTTILAQDKDKETVKNRLFEVIDQRWDRVKYTALLSNLSTTEIKDSISEATYSRLKENCLSFNFNWEDYRLQDGRQ